ncbi:MAG: YlmH/Sll1252 family protein [Firmicutes bacterium]|nr:YlmH/Sll1252 family protein [Bacillota bacterium]
MEDKILTNQIDDQIKKAKKNGVSATKFLTPTQLIEAKSYISYNKYDKEIEIIDDGGYIGAERKRLIFINKDWGDFERSSLFTPICIEHRKQDVIGHRDILGALMNIGIERNTIGDIETKNIRPTLVCLPEVSQYILENIRKIGNIGVVVKIITIEELGTRIEELKEELVITSSMRIDCLVAEIYKISRNQASDFIQQGKIIHNHKLVIKQDELVKEGDIITLRGSGKIKILSIEGITKKDRIKLKIGRYI